MVLGWIFIKLVAGGRRSNPVPAEAGGVPLARQGAGERKGPGQRGAAPRAGAAGPSAGKGSGQAGDARGREADKPTEIPTLGWKDILWRTYEEMGRDRLVSVAAGVTFYALLAIFPAVAALVSIYGLFADPATIEQHLSALSGFLPGGATEIVGEQVKRIASQGDGTLGLSFVAGLAISLWSANAGMKAVFDALNIVYDEEEKRGFIALNLRSLTFTVGAILFLLVALGAIVVLPIALEFIGLKGATEWLLSLVRWPALLAGVVLGLSLLYRYGPSRDKADWRWVTPGGIVAAVLWVVGSMLFSWYAANFGSYNETYGSLGAAIGFMTWIWISTIIILLGAEMNAEMEHQTAHDTTEGPHQPMGARGATMADTVGEAKA
jgi:membrane protein